MAARTTTTFRLSEEEDRRIAQLQEWLYDQNTGPVRSAVTASDVVRYALDRLYREMSPGRAKNKSGKL